MTDIVERLRALHTPPTGLSWDIPDLCNEAAAEIERLRSALKELVEAANLDMKTN